MPSLSEDNFYNYGNIYQPGLFEFEIENDIAKTSLLKPEEYLNPTSASITTKVYVQERYANHKYLILVDILSSYEMHYYCYLQNGSHADLGNVPKDKWTKCRVIKSLTANVNSGIRIQPAIVINDADYTYSVKNYMLIDLTLIYGEGNEPTTPEQFERDYKLWFGKELTFEPYDKGSIRETLPVKYFPKGMPEYVWWNQYNGSTTIPGLVIDVDNTEGTANKYITIGGYGISCPPNHVVYENIIFEYCNVEGRNFIYQNIRAFAIGNSGNKNNPILQANKTFYSAIGTSGIQDSNTNLILGITLGSKVDAKIKSMVLVDLTAIYGEGKEPTDPAQFEADFERWFGYPLGEEPYDEGSLRQIIN